MNTGLEELISRNLKYLTPQSIVNELTYVNKVYKLYLTEVDYYIDSLENTIRVVDMFYKHIYNLCLQTINGFTLLSNVGYIFIFTIRYLEYVKKRWYLYTLRYKTFFNTFNKYTSQFVLKVNLDQN